MATRIRTLDDPVEMGDLYCYQCRKHLICEGNEGTKWFWVCKKCNYCIVRIEEE